MNSCTTEIPTTNRPQRGVEARGQPVVGPVGDARHREDVALVVREQVARRQRAVGVDDAGRDGPVVEPLQLRAVPDEQQRRRDGDSARSCSAVAGRPSASGGAWTAPRRRTTAPRRRPSSRRRRSSRPPQECRRLGVGKARGPASPQVDVEPAAPRWPRGTAGAWRCRTRSPRRPPGATGRPRRHAVRARPSTTIRSNSPPTSSMVATYRPKSSSSCPARSDTAVEAGVRGSGGTARRSTCARSATLAASRAANSTSCSTEWTSPVRAASHSVLAPEPYSNTRAPGRSARKASTSRDAA